MNERAYEGFADWLRRISQSSPPPDDIAAHYFGLFESDGGYTAYLSGSREYDPGDDDWACREDYVPAEKYFVLREGFTAGTDWREVQRAVVGLVRRFIESPGSSGSFLAGASAVAVGFDDGDLERVA